MPAQPSYEDWLKQDMGSLIDALTLSDLQKHFLRSRWLDQVIWMGKAADKARSRYYALRMVTIIGGVLVPAGVSASFSDGLSAAWNLSGLAHWLTFSISLVVAMSAAIEEFFHFGERWRHYRQGVESLKGAGWNFFQLSGPFAEHNTHADAYREFAAHIEEILQQDVTAYVTRVIHEKKEKKGGNEAQGGDTDAA